MTSTDQIRAVGVSEYGDPDALAVVHLPAEPLTSGSVRLRVTAAAVNPTDTLVRTGIRAKNGRPADGVDVPGMDVAGVITEIHVDADTTLEVGDPVMAIVLPSGTHGGYREDLVLPASSVTRVPAGVDDIAACTLPMNGLTARLALDVMDLRPGQVLAVTGAAGAFGGYVVELAKHDGLTVIADASPGDRALVEQLGADIVVDRGDDFAARVREQFRDGVDGLADGALLDAKALPAVRDGGVVATVRGYAGDGQSRLRVIPVIVRSYVEEWAKLDELRALVETGEVTLRVAGTYPAEEAAEAHRRLEAGGARGRFVLQFSERR
jgi:NADPH:quinone reductase